MSHRIIANMWTETLNLDERREQWGPTMEQLSWWHETGFENWKGTQKQNEAKRKDSQGSVGQSHTGTDDRQNNTYRAHECHYAQKRRKLQCMNRTTNRETDRVKWQRTAEQWTEHILQGTYIHHMGTDCFRSISCWFCIYRAKNAKRHNDWGKRGNAWKETTQR